MSKVFISYRRSESAYVTGRIYDRLSRHFGAGEVFTDVDKMPMGIDFRRVIDEQVRKCQVLLAVIGANWLVVEGADGRPRLHDPADFVRIEIEAALRRGIPVIPVLVDGVAMPRAAQLPDSLRELAFRHGIAIRPDPDFHRDADRLIKGLDQHLKAAKPLAEVFEKRPGTPSSQRRRPDSAKARPARPKQSADDPEMVVVPAGTFRMGDVWGTGDSDELPVHEVRIAKAFAIGRYPVTFVEYDGYATRTGKEPPEDAGWGRGSRPVINVSWEDAQDYARWLSRQTGHRFRLPTEAEWEYAARGAGRDQQWPGTSDESELEAFAWYASNSGGMTQPVGGKKANGLGLHDMGGNVWEWVQDLWHDDYDGAPADGSAWEGRDGGRRVIRGGSWHYKPLWLRCSYRGSFHPVYRGNGVGFRLAQDLDRA